MQDIKNLPSAQRFANKNCDEFSQPRFLKTTITSAQLLSATTPITLIAGTVGYMTDIISVNAFFKYGTTTYLLGGDMVLAYVTSSTTIGSMAVLGVRSTINNWIQFNESKSGYGILTGEDIIIISTADFTTGDGELHLVIEYRLIEEPA